ncbi:MAG: hypothetical protein JO289_09165, partial [Xanthobacteraceae bacterium]|nr:hypothetical protein [Xanthobacteraceae bacterium]
TTRVYPDIDRKIPLRASITPGASYRRGRAPFARLAAAVRTSGLPARLSRDAGTYLCNYAYWRALGTTITDGRSSRRGVCSRPQHAPPPENQRSLKSPRSSSAPAGGAERRDLRRRGRTAAGLVPPAP